MSRRSSINWEDGPENEVEEFAGDHTHTKGVFS